MVGELLRGTPCLALDVGLAVPDHEHHGDQNRLQPEPELAPGPALGHVLEPVLVLAPGPGPGLELEPGPGPELAPEQPELGLELEPGLEPVPELVRETEAH